MRKRQKKSKSAGETPKVNHYVRDILLLPKEFEKKKIVSVPRCSARTRLGKAELIGKVEFHSGMSEEEVRTEICEVFSVPMGLKEENMKNKRLLEFHFLQKAGNSSRTLQRRARLSGLVGKWHHWPKLVHFSIYLLKTPCLDGNCW